MFIVLAEMFRFFFFWLALLVCMAVQDHSISVTCGCIKATEWISIIFIVIILRKNIFNNLKSSSYKQNLFNTGRPRIWYLVLPQFKKKFFEGSTRYQITKCSQKFHTHGPSYVQQCRILQKCTLFVTKLPKTFLVKMVNKSTLISKISTRALYE